MKQMTEQHMINAFGGESMAHMRYLHFSLQAEKESLSNVARLFSAISYAEFVHAGDHYRELRHLDGGFVANSMAAFGPGDTRKNLDLAVAGETFEIEEMYPAYIAVAELQKEKGAKRSFEWSYASEKTHKALFERGVESVAKGGDMELGPVHVCSVCGYTVEGTAPDPCPVCQAKKEKFKEFN